MDELEEALKKKDEDMKQMEERYKKYLEKAKSVSVCSGLAVAMVTPLPHEHLCPLQVIRTLDPKQNQGSGPEVQALKNQLQEKERLLHSMEVRPGSSRPPGSPRPHRGTPPGTRRRWCPPPGTVTPLFVPQQKEMDKAKGQRDYEEKMIVSAWYNMVHGPTLTRLISLA